MEESHDVWCYEIDCQFLNWQFLQNTGSQKVKKGGKPLLTSSGYKIVVKFMIIPKKTVFLPDGG